MPQVRWGAVAVGAAAGIGFGLIGFLVLGITGVVGSDGSAVPLIFMQYVALVVAGVVAARVSPDAAVLNGSLAGLALFAATTIIGLAISTGRPGAVTLVFGGVMAAVIGAAGGALAEWRRI